MTARKRATATLRERLRTWRCAECGAVRAHVVDSINRDGTRNYRQSPCRDHPDAELLGMTPEYAYALEYARAGADPDRFDPALWPGVSQGVLALACSWERRWKALREFDAPAPGGNPLFGVGP